MHGKVLKSARMFLPLSILVFTVSLLTAPVPTYSNTQQTAPDNTKKNKDQNPPTADQQKDNSSDLAVTQKIRKAIIEDKSLSTYAHNVKIITQNRKVILRGPVRSEDEKNLVEAKAVGVAGQENVTNELKVAPSK